MLSPRKTQSAVNLNRKEIPRKCPSISKSSESLYSNTCSSKSSISGIYGRRPQPKYSNSRVGGRDRPVAPKPNEIHQRVVSARRLRVKSFQNQLSDAQQHIVELAQENRMLRTLHKRQDSALSKYESNNAELPQLLHSHAEQIRCWQTKYKTLQTTNKELTQKLKLKEAQILSLSDQNKYYSQLNKNKNLDDRQKLNDRVQFLETQLQEKESELTLLARKLQMQSTTFKKKLQVEHKKSKDACVKLEKTKFELTGYKKLDELDLTKKFSKLAVDPIDLNDDIDDKPEYRKTKVGVNRLARDGRKQIGETPKEVTFSKPELKTPRTIPLMAFPIVETPSTTRADLHQGDGDAPSSENIEKPMDVGFEKSDYEEDYEEVDDDDIDDDDNTNDNDDDDAEDISNDEDEDEEQEDEEEENYMYCRDSSRKTKKVISEIRQQISEEYNGREAFLDDLCSNSTKIEGAGNTKSNNLDAKPNIQSNRKSQLLAALKAIDTSKTEN